jgi:hypothetical protein
MGSGGFTMDDLERIWCKLSAFEQRQLGAWREVLEAIGDPLRIITLDGAGQIGIWKDSIGVYTLWRLGPDHLWRENSFLRYSTEFIDALGDVKN